MLTKAEIKVMLLRAQEEQKLPASHQKLGKRHRTDFLSEPSEDRSPADIVISDL